MRNKKLWRCLLAAALAMQMTMITPLGMSENSEKDSDSGCVEMSSQNLGQIENSSGNNNYEDDSYYGHDGTIEENNEENTEEKYKDQNENADSNDNIAADTEENKEANAADENESTQIVSTDTATSLSESSVSSDPVSSEETSEENHPEETTEDGVHAEIKVYLPDGSLCPLYEKEVPHTLECDGVMLPVDYADGVYTVTAPAGTEYLQINLVPFISDDIEIQLPFYCCRWDGYLWQDQEQWKLYPSFIEDEYVYASDAFDAEVTTWIVDEDEGCLQLPLEDFYLGDETYTLEQNQVYGELNTDESNYAEICVGYFDMEGERFENLLLLVEIEKESADAAVMDENPDKENSDTENSESVIQEEYQENAITEEAGEIASETLDAAIIPDDTKTNTIYQTTGNNLANKANTSAPIVGAIGGEWEILGLVRSEQQVSDAAYEAYLNNLKKKLTETSGVLHDKKYTEYSRVVLALTCLGEDVSNFGGYNLLQPLADYDRVVWQGVNGAGWALIALDSHNYAIPVVEEGKTQTTREKLVDHILSKELKNGGWALSGTSADVDITAMMIQALAPYYENNARVKAAVDRGLDKLSALQSGTGDFATQYGTQKNYTAESCAQVVVALTALKINPATDTRFIKNGNTVIDALLSYAKGSGFMHIAGGNVDGMATEQAYYALTAYERFINKKTSLYDMSDIDAPGPTVTPTPTPDPTIPTSTPIPTKIPTQTPTMAPRPTSIPPLKPTSTPSPTRKPEPTSTPSPTNTQAPTATPAANNTKAATGGTKSVSLTTDTDSNSETTTSGNTKESAGTNRSSKNTTETTAKKTDNTKNTDQSLSKSEKQDSANSEAGSTSFDDNTKPNYTDRARKVAKDLGALYTSKEMRLVSFGDEKKFTKEQMLQMNEVWEAYQNLTAEEKKAVSTHARYENFISNIETIRMSNHVDLSSGISLQENEDAQLPWYIQMKITPELEDETVKGQISEVLGNDSEIYHVWDIQLYDTLHDKVWEPKEIIHIDFPMEPLGEMENVVVTHWTHGGELECLNGELRGELIRTDTVEFSRYATVGIKGSLHSILNPPEKENTILIWVIAGCAVAGVFLVILLMIRINMKSEE